MNSIFILVYTSKSNVPIDKNFLKNLLDKSGQNNKRDNITGFLATRDGYFLQLLEGAEKDVLACYERIQKDSRHRFITLQGTATIESRIMPSWNMGYVEENQQTNSAEQLLDLFELGKPGRAYTTKESLEAMLRLFSKNAQVFQENEIHFPKK